MKIPHNCFTAWMVSPCKPLSGSWPVDLLEGLQASLFPALEAFGHQNTGTVAYARGRAKPGSWFIAMPATAVAGLADRDQL